jgi:hypothetical protein
MLTLLLGFTLIALGLAAFTGRLFWQPKRLPALATPLGGMVAMVLGAGRPFEAYLLGG